MDIIKKMNDGSTNDMVDAILQNHPSNKIKSCRFSDDGSYRLYRDLSDNIDLDPLTGCAINSAGVFTPDYSGQSPGSKKSVGLTEFDPYEIEVSKSFVKAVLEEFKNPSNPPPEKFFPYTKEK